MKTTLLAIVASLVLCAASGAGETVTLSTNEWPPFLSETLEHNGLAARIVREAFAAEGISVRYRFLPWKRAYHDALSGAVDGSVVWSRTEEREQEMLFSDPVIETNYVFFHRKETPFRWSGMEDLRGLRVGGIDGFNYGEPFWKARQEQLFVFEGVAADEQNYRKLIAGRIDLFPQELQVGRYQLSRSLSPGDARRITFHPRSLKTGTSHLIMSKSSPGSARLIQTFNKGLKKLRETGKMKQMLESKQRNRE